MEVGIAIDKDDGKAHTPTTTYYNGDYYYYYYIYDY